MGGHSGLVQLDQTDIKIFSYQRVVNEQMGFGTKRGGKTRLALADKQQLNWVTLL